MDEYRLPVRKLVQLKCAYQKQGSRVIIFSPPDDFCFYKALAHFAYRETHRPGGCESAY
jgi:hypothetical protein